MGRGQGGKLSCVTCALLSPQLHGTFTVSTTPNTTARMAFGGPISHSPTSRMPPSVKKVRAVGESLGWAGRDRGAEGVQLFLSPHSSLPLLLSLWEQKPLFVCSLLCGGTASLLGCFWDLREEEGARKSFSSPDF